VFRIGEERRGDLVIRTADQLATVTVPGHQSERFAVYGMRGPLARVLEPGRRFLNGVLICRGGFVGFVDSLRNSNNAKVPLLLIDTELQTRFRRRG